MFKKRIIKLIESGSEPAGSAACSAAAPPCSRAAFHLLRAPELAFDCGILTRVDTSRLLSSLCSSSSGTFMCFFVGTLNFLPKLFPEAEMRNFPFFFFSPLPESFLILAKEQPREVSDDDSHRERADKPVWLRL